MNTYTFKTSNNNNNNTKKFFTFSFLKKNKPTDYSKVLDDIILDNLMETNSYLKDYKTKQEDAKIFEASTASLKGNEFVEAASFLANYSKKNTFPFILGKVYKLAGNIPVIFYDDEIQIDRDIYSYDDFENLAFLNTLSAPKKKIIIDIYTNSHNINIEINK